LSSQRTLKLQDDEKDIVISSASTIRTDKDFDYMETEKEKEFDRVKNPHVKEESPKVFL